MQHRAIIATHHKTGTVWMRTIFKEISSRFKIPLIVMNNRKRPDLENSAAPAIILNHHSDFSNAPWLLTNPDSRILHIIRDPRDIIISAAHYHRISTETWLHEPKAAYDGLSYQQKLNSLPDQQSRYMFEIDNSSKWIVKAMGKWNYNLPTSFECKYEDLILDVEMALFTNILLHLGFNSAELKRCKTVVWKHSLFGNRAKDGSKHIRSGEGRQWPDIFNRELAEAFEKRLGHILIKLGYEPNNSWIERCPPHHLSAGSKLGKLNVL